MPIITVMSLVMGCGRTLLVILITIAGSSEAALAQDALSRAKTLYQNAAYEDALALLDENADPATSAEVHQYRALCLLAVGRVSDAERAIAVVVKGNPFLRPDPPDVAPRLVAVFADTRRKLLPEIVESAFDEAKSLFLKGDRERASQRFNEVHQLLEDSALAGHRLPADLRLVVDNYLDLLRAETKAQKSAPSASSAIERKPAVVTPPIALSRELPQWRAPHELAARATFAGAVKVTIDANG